MLDKVLFVSMGLAIASPLASYYAAHPAASAAQPPVQYVTIIRRVPVPIHDAPRLELAALSAPLALNVPGASMDTVPPPAPSMKPELPPRDEAENKLLACVTPRMRQLWDKIEEQFGRLQIICTCDHSYYVAGTRRVSWHVSGNAIDFLAGDKRYAILAWLARHHTTGLTMTYNDSKHIHVDVGGYVHMALAARDRALRVPGADAPARYVSARRHSWHQMESDDDGN